jgi:hypothetical protein
MGEGTWLRATHSIIQSASQHSIQLTDFPAKLQNTDGRHFYTYGFVERIKSSCRQGSPGRSPGSFPIFLYYVEVGPNIRAKA